MTAPQADDHSSDLGKTEAEIELAHGEIPGDRLGDTPVDGVAQTRDGAGNPITPEQAEYAAKHGTEGSDPAPQLVLVQDGEIVHTDPSTATHTLVPNDSVSAFRRLLDGIENVPHEVFVFFEAHFGHHAAA